MGQFLVLGDAPWDNILTVSDLLDLLYPNDTIRDGLAFDMSSLQKTACLHSRFEKTSIRYFQNPRHDRAHDVTILIEKPPPSYYLCKVIHI